MAFDSLHQSTAAAWRMDVADYPEVAPFHPAQKYPEYRGGTLGAENLVYDAVRGLLHTLGLDAARFGTRDWNLPTAFVPQQPGAVAPIILRLDDNTVGVTYKASRKSTCLERTTPVPILSRWRRWSARVVARGLQFPLVSKSATDRMGGKFPPAGFGQFSE